MTKDKLAPIYMRITANGQRLEGAGNDAGWQDHYF